MSEIIKEGNFKTDGNWWEKKTDLRYTTNPFNILFSQTHKNNAKEFYFVTYSLSELKLYILLLSFIILLLHNIANIFTF